MWYILLQSMPYCVGYLASSLDLCYCGVLLVVSEFLLWRTVRGEVFRGGGGCGLFILCIACHVTLVI